MASIFSKLFSNSRAFSLRLSISSEFLLMMTLFFLASPNDWSQLVVMEAIDFSNSKMTLVAVPKRKY